MIRRIHQALAPLLLAAAALLPLAAAGWLPAGFVVLGLALTLSRARLDRRHGSSLTVQLLRIPLVVVALAGLGWLLQRERPLGDLLVVAVVFGALLARRAGPRLNAFGRALLLPLISLFVAPVPVGGDPARDLLRVVLVAAVATIAGVLPNLLPAHPASTDLRRGTARSLHRRARELDARLPPEACAARLALLRVEQAADDRTGLEEAFAALDDALAGLEPVQQPVADLAADPVAETPGTSGTPSPARASVLTRLAAQSAVAVALALVVGQLVFPAHWTWTVITALTLTVGARSRGDVALRGLQRLGGALVGTTVSTLTAAGLAGHPAISVAVMIVVLCAGVVLRDVDYAWWAACLTAVLGLLYGVLGQAGGPEVLGERLLAILVGAACAVLPAFFLRPVHTHLIVRRRAADWLAAVRPLLEATTEPGAAVSAARAAEARAHELREAVRPIALLRYPRDRPEPEWRDAAQRGATVARRVALGDETALPELRSAYRIIGRGLRPRN